MPVEIRVPEMGESITEATITRWLKKEGEAVSADEPVAELETDKVNVEVAAPQAGVLQTLTKPEGATVAVGDVIAVIGDGAAPGAAPPAAAAPGRAETAPAAPTGNGQAPTSSGEGTYTVTPIARRLAEDNGVDLSRVAGTGPQGRITKEDVEGYLGRGAAAAPQATPEAAEHGADQAVEYDARPVAPPVAPPAPDNGGARGVQPVPGQGAASSAPTAPIRAAGGPAPAAGRPETRQRMSRRRQTIATRLVEAQHTAAMLTTFNEVDMSAMLALRARHKEAFEKRHEGVRLGFMSFFTKAVVGALKAFPLLNAEIQGTDIVIKHYVDMGIAVSTEEGLVVPVVRDADRKTFAEIEKDVADLAKRARDGKLTLADLQGGTFTITNGGVFGSLLSTPILNAPQVGILGMHKTQDRPVVVGGEVVVRPMMYLALSYDHRIVDGSEAVRFLVRVKELVEDPEQLLLEA